MVRRIPVAAARKRLASLIHHSSTGDRIRLTRYGKTVAVVISKRDLDALENCESTSGRRVGRAVSSLGPGSKT